MLSVVLLTCIAHSAVGDAIGACDFEPAHSVANTGSAAFRQACRVFSCSGIQFVVLIEFGV